MDHFIDIKVLPDPEFNATTLMNALYAKLHRGLVTLQNESLGVSFPAAGKTPGDLLRLHGTKPDLERLMELNWIKGLGDYTATTELQLVPADLQQVRIRRIQSKMTAARIRRSVARNTDKSLDEQQATELLEKRQPLKLPYLMLKSQSTGQQFPLHFEQKAVGTEAVSGTFNSYGFSQTATLPWF
ncbi:type I-F CRISPR-associated endoribonuclease Cas6/Csy4 [Marinospirillum perlucidum]|uniref:type I-F CRISPR-associated endoribonuclease Cas6/Csy4 n=1 Tax=Marinospirillum perlucidum TaxID=1982602 RepID=UPI000DF26EC6|nr:type I-F CRISPR-associated endoribonuclease Cas6/Csy4 [Marinospirillum perlucidum]